MQNEIVIFKTDDETINVEVRFEDETAWLTQDQMSSLFGKSKSTINEHIKNIFEDDAEKAFMGLTTFVTHEQAVNKATGEYRKYQQKTLFSVEKAFLDSIKSIEKKLKNDFY